MASFSECKREYNSLKDYATELEYRGAIIPVNAPLELKCVIIFSLTHKQRKSAWTTYQKMNYLDKLYDDLFVMKLVCLCYMQDANNRYNIYIEGFFAKKIK
jgi:hypothetical protein